MYRIRKEGTTMNRKYLTLHEAISEGRAEWAMFRSRPTCCLTVASA